MMATLLLAAAVLVLLAGLSTLVQVLYLESMRLLPRENRALNLFKHELMERMGLEAEQGSLTFSLVKHTALVALTVIAAWIGALASPDWRGVAQGVAMGWFAMVIATYLAPHLVYRRSECRWLLAATWLLRAMALAMRPLTALLNFLESLAELSEPESAHEDEATPAENIDALITAGEEGGLIEESDRKLIQSVVEFGDKTLREVMTPRPRIVGIDKRQTLEELRRLAINEQYSRILVFDGDIDHIEGFVHVRDLFELSEEERAGRTVESLLRRLKPVPESKRVSALLKDMQASGAHMAVVVDEYGGTAGIATMEDLVEEVFGEIRDEHEPDSDVVNNADGSIVVSGSYDLDHLHELLAFRPEEGIEATTVGGLATEWMGRVPKRGEAVERDGIRLEVLSGSDWRVDKVKVSRAREEDGNGH